MFTEVWLESPVDASLKIAVWLDEDNTPLATRMPCFVMGLSSHYHDKFSETFRQTYQLILCDQYWTDDRFSPEWVAQLTMQHLVSHIEMIRLQLAQQYGTRYDHLVVLGHSTYGFLALEYAKTYPAQVYGVINVCTPLFFQSEALEWWQEAYLDANYGPTVVDGPTDRWDDYYAYKAAYLEKLKTLTDQTARFIAWYISLGPLLWEQPAWWKNRQQRAERLWHPWCITVPSGSRWRAPNPVMLLHYLRLAASCDYRKMLQTVIFPILWFIGLYDARVSCYLFDNIPIGKSITLYFVAGGHWPMYETAQQAHEFDTATATWLRTMTSFHHSGETYAPFHTSI